MKNEKNEQSKICREREVNEVGLKSIFAGEWNFFASFISTQRTIEMKYLFTTFASCQENE